MGQEVEAMLAEEGDDEVGGEGDGEAEVEWGGDVKEENGRGEGARD